MIRILYLLFLFLSLTNSGISIGFKVKYLLALFLLVWTIFHDKDFFNNKLFIPYSLYIVCFGVCSAVAGNSSFFVQFFSAVFIPTFVGWRTTIFLLREDENFSKAIVLMLIAIGLFDIAVTASQFFLNASWYSPIEQLFQFKTREQVCEDGNFVDDLIGANTTGIFGSAVTNGFYLAACTAISVYFLYKSDRKIYILLPVIFVFGVFLTQERANFAVSALISVVMIFIYLKQQPLSTKVTTGIVTVILLLFVGQKMFEYSDFYELRYSTLGIDDTGRDFIYSKTLEYLSNHLLFPSFNDCIAYVGHAPHNLFLNAYLWGGPIGFCCIMFILFKQGKLIYETIRNEMTYSTWIQYCFAFSWIILLLVSFVHNNSIVDGNLLIWVIWGAISYNNANC